MKKEYILGLLICFFGVGFIILFLNDLYTYCIIVGTIIAALGILLLSEVVSKNKNNEFERKLNSVLNKYDAILVQSKLPELAGLNIIVVDKFEDLVDAQVEIRKPIFYMKQTESCSFVLLDQNNALVHIMKDNETVLAPIEIIMSELEKAKKKEDVDYSLLKDIERTTIIKLENSKSYKVSPIRKSSKDEEIEIL